MLLIGLGSYRRCSTRLEFEGVVTSLVGTFPEERCNGSVDDGLGFTWDTNDVVAEAVLKSPLDDASKGCGKSKDSEFVCWCYEKE